MRDFDTDVDCELLDDHLDIFENENEGFSSMSWIDLGLGVLIFAILVPVVGGLTSAHG